MKLFAHSIREVFLSSRIPFSAIMVVSLVSEIFVDKLARLFPLSCKNIFLSSLSIFFQQKMLNPLNESLNCWLLKVGNKELRSLLLSNCLDLFKVNGVITVDRIKYRANINIDAEKNKWTKWIFYSSCP